MKHVRIFSKCYASKLIAFLLIGICINAILCCDADVDLINQISSSMYSENALSFSTTLSKEDMKNILSKLDSDLVIYYEANHNTIGLYVKNIELFSMPLISGKLDSAFCKISMQNCAVIGSRIDNAHLSNGGLFIDINQLRYDVVAVLGLENMHTCLDYKMIVPISNSFMLNTNGVFVFDGSPNVVRNAFDYVVNVAKESSCDVRIVDMNNYGTLELFNEKPINGPIIYAIIVFLLLYIAVDTYIRLNRRRVVLSVLYMMGLKRENIVCEIAKEEMIPSVIGIFASNVVLLFRSRWFLSTTHSVIVNAIIIELLLLLFVLLIINVMVEIRIRHDVATSLKW